MSKWKCEICNSEFDNFHAQGFNHKIYCPLCYFKELNIRKDKEIERLNNIINELEEWLKEQRDYYYEYPYYSDFNAYGSKCDDILEKLKELKGEK